MDEHMHWLDYFIIATYIAQLYQIFFFAVPSAGSTAEMFFNLKRKSSSAEHHPAAAIANSTPKMVATATATLIVLVGAFVPLLTIISPVTNRYLLPVMELPPPPGFSIISAGLLLLGNILTYIAVATLRAHVSFHEFGETTHLYTAGIYRAVRNPITLGLAIIFSGFVLARPAVVPLFAMILFLLNSHYRIKMEEVYLEKRFGNEYLHYQAVVGKYFPKMAGRNKTPIRSFTEGAIKSHHTDTIQE